jgi:hypothetical protein
VTHRAQRPDDIIENPRIQWHHHQFVSVDERIGLLDSTQEVAALWNDAKSSAVGTVNMQPDLMFAADAGNLLNRIDGRAGRGSHSCNREKWSPVLPGQPQSRRVALQVAF